MARPKKYSAVNFIKELNVLREKYKKVSNYELVPGVAAWLCESGISFSYMFEEYIKYYELSLEKYYMSKKDEPKEVKNPKNKKAVKK